MVKSSPAQLDRIFQALSDSTRRAILLDVSRKEKTVGEIAGPHRMSLAAVSKHLTVLEDAKLNKRRREGSFQIVSLRADALMPAARWLAYYQQFWESRLDSLKNFLEEEGK